MYINKIRELNIGPIEKAYIDFPFYNDGSPKPIIFVGENGTGKSTLFSNIVDALYEIAAKAYNNAVLSDKAFGHSYYKTVSPIEIKLGSNFLCSYLEFQNDKSKIEYIFKSGKVKLDSLNKDYSIPTSNLGIWDNEENLKNVSVDEELSKEIFSNGIYCFFGPDRYEKPCWMGKKYFKISNYEHPSAKQKWNGELDNQISVSDVTPSTLQWLLDVIVDSRPDIQFYENGFIALKDESIENLEVLGLSRKNVEKIMSKILGEEVYFSLNYRMKGIDRFCIKSIESNKIIVPSLDSLSTGQLALFNMFATIVRYADNNDINKSFKLHEIMGIVVIDEIELHLHTKLQKEVLPKLIALFPKIQFIISTHAPLFLLGMDSQFTADGYEIYQMPTATHITSECFTEFKRAYDYFTETSLYEEKIKEAISANNSNKALIITEGSTDWKHMKAAYKALCNNKEIAEWLTKLDFEFLEYEPENSSEDSSIKLKMGESNLRKICKESSYIPQTRKLVFIADRDVKNAVDEMEENSKYKNWGNEVFSFCLPIPQHRSGTPEICIEHLYKNHELTRLVECDDGIKRRIFLGNEFDSHGFHLKDNYFCTKSKSCGNNSIEIIDGSSEKKVIKPKEEHEINYCLSKANFANLILNEKPPFNVIDFSSFIPIFELLREIINL